MEAQNRRIVVWNVRGLNDPSRRTVVRVVVADAAVSVVCLSESKLETVSAYTVGETLGPRFDHHVYLPTVGTAGGIVVTWCSADVRVLAQRVDDFSISIHLELEGGTPWWLTTVYGPTSEDRKAAFLDELRALRAALAGPWAIAGDFNMITDARDKNNSNLNRRAMAQFRALLNDLELRESCLLGR
jgi:exonuclease III